LSLTDLVAEPYSSPKLFRILINLGQMIYQSKALDLGIILTNRFDLIRSLYKKFSRIKAKNHDCAHLARCNFSKNALIK